MKHRILRIQNDIECRSICLSILGREMGIYWYPKSRQLNLRYWSKDMIRSEIVIMTGLQYDDMQESAHKVGMNDTLSELTELTEIKDGVLILDSGFRAKVIDEVG